MSRPTDEELIAGIDGLESAGRLQRHVVDLLGELKAVGDELVCVVATPPSGRATRDGCDCWACSRAASIRALVAKVEGR